MQSDESDLRRCTKEFGLHIVRTFSELPKTTEARFLENNWCVRRVDRRAKVLGDTNYRGNRNNEDTDNDRHNTVIAHGVRPDGATTDDAGTDEGIAGDNTGQRHEDAPRTGAINEGDSRA